MSENKKASKPKFYIPNEEQRKKEIEEQFKRVDETVARAKEALRKINMEV